MALPQRTATPRDGSRTITITPTPAPEEGSGNAGPDIAGVLRLRGARQPGPRVQWTEDVVDNEGMGKKKSKICCIYHKPKAYDESSDEDSSSDDDTDSEPDTSSARPSGSFSRRRNQHHSHAHRHDEHECAHVHNLPSDDDTNAYERQPLPNKGKGRA
ncbi:hypothetical protein PENSPDRAFT_688235 [Peniophora sp. CONT]|nr:hypothetical protein PENSPDRAFT_688235 [Peniophora sp. CONT]